MSEILSFEHSQLFEHFKQLFFVISILELLLLVSGLPCVCVNVFRCF